MMRGTSRKALTSTTKKHRSEKETTVKHAAEWGLQDAADTQTRVGVTTSSHEAASIYFTGVGRLGAICMHDNDIRVTSPHTTSALELLVVWG